MDRKTIRKILDYAKELKWKLSMAMDKISELQPSQTPNNTSKLKKYQWYRVIDGEIREWTDAKYTEAEMDIFPYNLQRWYKAEQTVETIVEGMGSCFEQELEEKLLYQIDCPAVATHQEVVDLIKKKSAFDNLSDEQMKHIESASVDYDVIDRIKKAGMFIVQSGEIDSIVEKAKHNVEFFSELLTRLKEYEAFIEDEKKKAVEQIETLMGGINHPNKIESIISSFENLLSDLVDQFELIKIQYDTIENDEVKLAVDEFITKIVKFQMEISDMIVDLKHSKNRCVLQ